MPGTRPRVKIVGHRGWPARFPDNCKAGIVAAADSCDMVEVDLRLTADDVVMLSHDPELGGRRVAESDWAGLESVDLGGGHHPVRLVDLLTEPELVPLDLEVKNLPGEVSPERGRDLARAVADLCRKGDVITSFWWPSMDELRVSHPHVATGLIVAAEGDLEDAVAQAVLRGHVWVVPHWTLVTEDAGATTSAAARAGVGVIAWGLDDPAQAKTMVARGVGGLVVDDPPAFVEALTPDG